MEAFKQRLKGEFKLTGVSVGIEAVTIVVLSALIQRVVPTQSEVETAASSTPIPEMTAEAQSIHADIYSLAGFEQMQPQATTGEVEFHESYSLNNKGELVQDTLVGIQKVQLSEFVGFDIDQAAQKDEVYGRAHRVYASPYSEYVYLEVTRNPRGNTLIQLAFRRPNN